MTIISFWECTGSLALISEAILKLEEFLVSSDDTKSKASVYWTFEVDHSLQSWLYLEQIVMQLKAAVLYTIQQ